MNGRRKYSAAFAAFAWAALVTAPTQAASFDVAFYELTEEATFVFDATGFVKRTGSGSLAGEANVGSPLCPQPIASALTALGFTSPGVPCYVTATGADVINADGTGSLEATIQVKVQGDNPVDAPELVVMVAHLAGALWVADPHQRLLALQGTLTTVKLLDPTTFALVDVPGPSTKFTGTVRLPFVEVATGNHRKPRRHEQAVYLGDHGQLIPVRNNEKSLGLATARFELNFPNGTGE